ncbi:hypothetical protein PMIN06_006319 [Paraphaeosphaeria minitans]
MPPKKAAATRGDAGDDASDKFSWTPENERKLLLFMIGTTSFSKEDTERLAEHAFKGTSASAVKQKANKMRIEHRAIYEEHGWPTPDGKPAVKSDKDTPKKAATSRTKKRAAAAADGTDDAPATPSKKGRKDAAAEEKVSEDGDGPGDNLDGGIKAEAADEI